MSSRRLTGVGGSVPIGRSSRSAHKRKQIVSVQPQRHTDLRHAGTRKEVAPFPIADGGVAYTELGGQLADRPSHLNHIANIHVEMLAFPTLSVKEKVGMPNSRKVGLCQHIDMTKSSEINRGPVGELIRAARRQKDWTQIDLAVEIEAARGTVAAWEIGADRPGREYAIALNKVFPHIPVDDFLGITPSPTAPSHSYIAENADQAAAIEMILGMTTEELKALSIIMGRLPVRGKQPKPLRRKRH